MFIDIDEIKAFAFLLGAGTPWSPKNHYMYPNSSTTNFWLDFPPGKTSTEIHELMFQLTEMGYYAYLVTDPNNIGQTSTVVFVTDSLIAESNNIYQPYKPGEIDNG